ncbi:phosphotransferase [Kribbella qitaiheensis]|uniref:Phosphotransferase n=1 Tax=Kribbella qitaiheensis TaxID=1544730 RepID=A0A7G6WZL2_9ACTN|nr:aminoglycoside phosphotransferase family protein [Kribbella qitaiheensis]QNE19427.1 phosphotransferase [Kribbella qitaiheensis]
MALGEVSEGCRRRLVGHYGAAALEWVEEAPGLLQVAAARWGLSLMNYHDAGHASVVSTAVDQQGRRLMVKAWTDPARYRHEVAALRHWAGGPAVEVIETADDLCAAALEMVGGEPGGRGRPAGELTLVAEALQHLHALGRQRSPAGFPLLADYLQGEVAPRVWKRLRDQDLGQWRPVAQAGLHALREAAGAHPDGTGQQTLLHGDLYRENVLFSDCQQPVFLDPLPMLGSEAFDWAFWVVYYEVECGFEDRLALAQTVSGLPVQGIRRWCTVLFLDGLLYYLETHDPRTSLLGNMATAFVRNNEGRSSWST